MSPRTLSACVVAGALGVLCAVAVGCGGSSKLLTGSDADALKQGLTEVRQAVDARDCPTAATKLKRLRKLAVNLPGSVDRGLRRNLREEIDGTLAPQVVAECNDPQTTTTPTITTTTPPPTTPSEPTTTTEPPTTPTGTTPTGPTGPPPTEPTPPPTGTSTTPAPGGTGGASPDGGVTIG